MLAERPERAPYPQTSRFANLFSLTSLTRARPALLPPDAACSPAPLTGHTCSPLAFLVDLFVPSPTHRLSRFPRWLSRPISSREGPRPPLAPASLLSPRLFFPAASRVLLHLDRPKVILGHSSTAELILTQCPLATKTETKSNNDITTNACFPAALPRAVSGIARPHPLSRLGNSACDLPSEKSCSCPSPRLCRGSARTRDSCRWIWQWLTT